MEKIIHVGKIGQKEYLFLVKEDEGYRWEGTDIVSASVAGAIEDAYEAYAVEGFSLLHCGFRYTLPERDEVGVNALFCHMVKSYKSMNGVYFDEELEHPCFVDFASHEALDLWRNGR